MTDLLLLVLIGIEVAHWIDQRRALQWLYHLNARIVNKLEA